MHDDGTELPQEAREREGTWSFGDVMRRGVRGVGRVMFSFCPV